MGLVRTCFLSCFESGLYLSSSSKTELVEVRSEVKHLCFLPKPSSLQKDKGRGQFQDSMAGSLLHGRSVLKARPSGLAGFVCVCPEELKSREI